jgi:hypothetical protein
LFSVSTTDGGMKPPVPIGSAGATVRAIQISSAGPLFLFDHEIVLLHPI